MPGTDDAHSCEGLALVLIIPEWIDRPIYDAEIEG